MLLLYKMNKHSRYQYLIPICSIDLCVLLHVVAEVSVQLNFLEVS